VSNLFKYTKYLLILIIVACGSSSKEVDFQELSINAVKNELLDPNSFELIKYSLDTIYNHEEALILLRLDSSKVDIYNNLLYLSVELDEKEKYNEYLDALNDTQRRIDSSKSLLDNPDMISKYRATVLYYSNGKGGMRVINKMGITFNLEGIVGSTYSLD
jgi:hypothetical protein